MRSLASCLLLACVLSPLRADDARADAIKTLYKKRCASCHGLAGEGSKRYKHQLVGEKSPAELAKIIQKTMPENDPGSLSKTDADLLVGYIYDAFYSKAAQARNKPPRIELARLTVPQYRQAVTDLITGSRTTLKLDGKRGLKAEYYRNRRFRGVDRVLERIDPRVRFDFGTDTPVPGKTEPHEFSIRWTGSLLAPATGEYEFVIHTEHALRFWLNDMRRPLIDAWVKSGNDTEYRGSIFLVAGRTYPLRLEYSKAKQGVDDSKKNKGKPKPVKSSIALAWKLPHRNPATVPERNLLPVGASASFVSTVPFPPDDRSYGWIRGTTVSKEWDQATTEGALEAAGFVARNIDQLAGTRGGDKDRQAKIKDYCRRLAERAFRRPLTDAQKQLYIERQFTAAGDVDSAVKRVVLLVLKSPRFLYREAGGNLDAFDVAARLSFGLWDSLPDQALLDAAAAGQLSTPEQIRRQAERMLDDPRAHVKLRSFLLSWLDLDHPRDLAKDAKKHPGFDAGVIEDLRASLELFLDDVVWSERSDFRRLFLADAYPLNGRLARFYDIDKPEQAGFEAVKLDNGKRAGVLTHPYLLAAFAYTEDTSPIHRGVFLARGVLGRAIRPPPEAFTPIPAKLHPDLTTRERVSLQTRSNTCMACHGMINQLGFTLEHFDAVGRFRQQDNARKVDASGAYQTRAGKVVRLAGARPLAEFLAGSPEVQEAFAEQMFHHLVQQPVNAYGPNNLANLRQAFVKNDYSIRKLAVEVMAASALKPTRGASK